ncbi:uncharacterized protein [Acropora muricata]|uniref:uncharacterized protein n=1 Tax=Acropora muricata TaxID=159855 RepID=UPI0034E3E997
MAKSFIFIVITLAISCLQTAESTKSPREGQTNSAPRANVMVETTHRTIGLKKEPLKDKMLVRKNVAFREASSSMIMDRLKDELGRIPWSNHPAAASYTGETGGLSQQRLLSIVNQLTNDIRVNGRRISPMQAQIVQQSSNGEINPTPSLNDMQNDIVTNIQQTMHGNMQDDLSSKPSNLMQDDAQNTVIRPIHVPMNNAGNSEQAIQPSSFERLMFGGLSQVAGTGEQNKGYSEFGGGMSNIPGLSIGGQHNSGVINLMESENGLKPMTGMGNMNGVFNGMKGIHMMGGTGRMGGKMWGGDTYFNKRRGAVSPRKNDPPKEKTVTKYSTSVLGKNKGRKVNHVKKIHHVQNARPSVIRLVPSERLTLAEKRSKLKITSN